MATKGGAIVDELTADFFEQNDHALRSSKIVLRDSLGALAVQILVAREDVAHMDYSKMLHKLYDIIDDLHSAYDSNCPDFGVGRH